VPLRLLLLLLLLLHLRRSISCRMLLLLLLSASVHHPQQCDVDVWVGCACSAFWAVPEASRVLPQTLLAEAVAAANVLQANNHRYVLMLLPEWQGIVQLTYIYCEGQRRHSAKNLHTQPCQPDCQDS
jgi:hypothetical protein